MHWKSAAAVLTLVFAWDVQSAQTPGPAAADGKNGRPPILVELFTSEGCSSCPPADELLSRISGKTLPSGRTVVTISEHVTYWNHEGWEDPFSSMNATARQQSYVDRLRVNQGPYTPQMVVNGFAQMNGSDGAAVAEALKQADAATSDAKLALGDVTVDKGEAEVHFEVTGGDRRARKLEVTAFVTDDRDQVEVKTGENAHRTLTHVTVERAVQRVDLAKGASSGVIRVKVPGKPPMGAGSGRHLIVVAQEENEGPVLAVAMRSL